MSISKYFVEDKYLKSVLNNYIVRDSQISISNSINEALEKEYNLVVEAPTGSGKTMSYLIPALYSDKRIIISTKTKQLMNQLLYRDIPNVQKVDFFHKTIRELKGRKNYFCPHRYFKHINSKPAFYIDAVDWYNNSINEGGVFYVPHGKLDNEVCNLSLPHPSVCGHAGVGPGGSAAAPGKAHALSRQPFSRLRAEPSRSVQQHETSSPAACQQMLLCSCASTASCRVVTYMYAPAGKERSSTLHQIGVYQS